MCLIVCYSKFSFFVVLISYVYIFSRVFFRFSSSNTFFFRLIMLVKPWLFARFLVSWLPYFLYQLWKFYFFHVLPCNIFQACTAHVFHFASFYFASSTTKLSILSLLENNTICLADLWWSSKIPWVLEDFLRNIFQFQVLSSLHMVLCNHVYFGY